MIDVDIFMSFTQVFMDFLCYFGTDCAFWDTTGDGVVGMADMMDFLANYQPTDWVNGDDLYGADGSYNGGYGCDTEMGSGLIEYNRR